MGVLLAMARLPKWAFELLADLSRPPPLAPISVEARRSLRAFVSRALGGVDVRASNAIERLIDLAGVEFVDEVLRRCAAEREGNARVRRFFRIAQRHLSYATWQRIAPRSSLSPFAARDPHRTVAATKRSASTTASYEVRRGEGRRSVVASSADS